MNKRLGKSVGICQGFIGPALRQGLKNKKNVIFMISSYADHNYYIQLIDNKWTILDVRFVVNIQIVRIKKSAGDNAPQ